MKKKLDHRTLKRKSPPTNRSRALKAKEAHDKAMKGKKTVLIPHPTLERTWIQKIIEILPNINKIKQ